jgi:ABC-type branched-subunit amino acid transport system substrate-binding protein
VREERHLAVTTIASLLAVAAFGGYFIRDFKQSQTEAGTSVVVNVPAAASGASGPGNAAAGSAASAAPGAASGRTTTTVVAGGNGQGIQGSGGPAAGAASANQKACQNGVIRLGSIVAVTGPIVMQTAADALEAYFKRVNSSGGIGGCQVELTYKDDGLLNNQQALADAHELVQADKVFAIVGPFEPITTNATEPYFAQQGVPVVGIEGAGVNEYNSPVEYSFAISPDGFGTSTADYANSKGFKHLAVFFVDLDLGVKAYNAFVAAAQRNGQTVEYHNQENISSNSYATDTLAAKNALSSFDPSTTAVVNIFDANSAVREMNAMSSNGWYPNMVTTTSSSDPVVVDSEADFLNHSGHAVYAERNYYPANADIPEVKDWLATEGQYFPGFDPNSYAEGAWLAAKVFTDLATTIGPDKLTRANLFAALNGLRSYHTGLTPDLSMTPDHGPNKQVLWMRWQGGAFQQVTGFQPW